MRPLCFYLVFALFCGCAQIQQQPQPGNITNQAPQSTTVRTGTDPEPVAVFDALCAAIRDDYPMLEFVGWLDEGEIAAYRARVATAPTREAAFELMDEIVCRLNDYHTRFSWPGKPSRQSPQFHVEPVLAATQPADRGIWGRVRPPAALPPLDGIAIAVTDADPATGLRPGDEILSVDGAPVRDTLARAWLHGVGSSAAGKLRSAAGRMLQGPAKSTLELRVRRPKMFGEQVLTLTVPRTKSPSEKTISCRELDGVPVIRIARWKSDSGEDLAAQFDDLLAKYRNRPALIIDVRGNGGGEDSLADKITGRFLSAPALASISFHRQISSQTFERKILTTAPRGPWRYAGRVAVLTDEGCMSACEHFVSGMIEAGALACGTPTSGACGLIRGVDLPGGAHLNISQTFPLHTGGIPSPQLGIAPHIWAPRTLADLRKGRDTALDAALAWLKGKEERPVRFQPMTEFSGSGK